MFPGTNFYISPLDGYFLIVAAILGVFVLIGIATTLFMILPFRGKTKPDPYRIGQ